METIDCVTKRHDELYGAFIDRILPNPIARRVKIADLLDNMNLVRLGREITDKDVARLPDNRVESVEPCPSHVLDFDINNFSHTI